MIRDDEPIQYTAPALNWTEEATYLSIRDMDLASMWEQSQSMVKRWWGGHRQLDEILGIASEAFVEQVNEFDDWCNERDMIPGRALFFHMVKIKMRWAIGDYWLQVLKPAAADQDLDAFESAEEVFTQLRFKQHDSILQVVLASKIRSIMSFTDRVALALLVWEELSLRRVGELMNIHETNLSAIAKRAASKVLVVALNQTSSSTVPESRRTKGKWQPPYDLVEYIYDKHRVPIETWLARVEADYAIDVSYLVEIIDRAHGNTVKRGLFGVGSGGFKATINEYERAEIIERVNAGEAQTAVAGDMGMSLAIVHRTVYQDRKARQQG